MDRSADIQSVCGAPGEDRREAVLCIAWLAFRGARKQTCEAANFYEQSQETTSAQKSSPRQQQIQRLAISSASCSNQRANWINPHEAEQAVNLKREPRVERPIRESRRLGNRQNSQVEASASHWSGSSAPLDANVGFSDAGGKDSQQ